MASGEWQSVHIFYAGNRRPLLTDCVHPLVQGLRADGLLASYFFMNYWLEGPHMRLRILPVDQAATGEVRRRVDVAISGYLRERPALYQVKSEFLVGMYNTLFDMEFTDEQRNEYIGPDGQMRLRDNNTYRYQAYEPEYSKYGGVAGVALAEWNFEYSSDLVIQATKTMNLHLRPVVLGLSAQLMMVMTTAFLQGDESTIQFLQMYHDFWRRGYSAGNFVGESEYDAAYDMMGDRVSRRFTDLRAACLQGQIDHIPELLQNWFHHCVLLRERIADLAVRGDLVLQSWEGPEDEVVTNVDHAVRRLLSPLLHMTNNRLSVTFTDEAYLGHTLARALRETREESL
jgi:hypothetical protein